MVGCRLIGLGGSQAGILRRRLAFPPGFSRCACPVLPGPIFVRDNGSEGRGETAWAETLVQPIQVRLPKISRDAHSWPQWMQQQSLSIGLIQDSNDARDEMWGYDSVVIRHLEDLACRPLRYENPDVCLNGECVEDEEGWLGRPCHKVESLFVKK